MWSDEEEDWGDNQSVDTRKRKKSSSEETCYQDDLNTLQTHCIKTYGEHRSQLTLSDTPLLAACVEDGLIVVTNSSVIKQVKNEDTCENLMSCDEHTKIVEATIRKDKLYIHQSHLADSKTINIIVALNLQSKDIQTVYKSETKINWFLAVKAANLKSSFFQANNLDLDVGKDDTLLLVESQKLLHIIQDTNKSKSRPISSVKYKSKLNFILHNIEINQDERKVEKFVDLLSLIKIRKKLEGFVSEEEIVDIQLCNNMFIILVKSGTLWMYDTTTKYFIIDQAKSFSIINNILTVLSNDLRIYSGDVDEVRQKHDSLSCKQSFQYIKDLAQNCDSVAKHIEKEKLKLNQLQLFRKLNEGMKLFEVETKLEQGCELGHDTRNKLLIRVTLNDQNTVIHDNFFVLKHSLTSRNVCQERSFALKFMKFGDSFTSTIHLDISDTSQFPCTIATHLVMLESAIIDNSSNFVYHEPLFTKQISPFLFLKPTYTRKSDISQYDHQDVDMQKVNDRSRFLDLLDCSEKHSNRIIKTDLCMSTAMIDSDSFDDNFKAIFNMDSTDTSLSFSLFDKNVEFRLKECSSDVRKLIVQAETDVISVLTKYIDHLKEIGQSTSTFTKIRTNPNGHT